MDNSTTGNTPSAQGSGNGAAGSPQKIVDRAAQTAHQTVDRLAAAAGPAIERLSSRASTARETLSAKAEQFGAMEEQWIADARGYVREHPFTAVAIGVLAGWLIAKIGSSNE